MNYKTDDLLYGFMRCLSTARPIGKDESGKTIYREYLPKKEFVKNKKMIASICDCSTRTVDRHLNTLADAGLIDEGIEIVETANGETYEYSCFWFPVEAKRYKLIEKDMVRYLIDTRNAQSIKVYLYLLNKYEWKPDYTFTLVELQKALGYAESSKTATTSMGNIIESLAREGIIDYKDDYDYIEKYGEIHKIPVKQLKFVAKSKKQLRDVG